MTSPRLTSQDYLAQLRARRVGQAEPSVSDQNYSTPTPETYSAAAPLPDQATNFEPQPEFSQPQYIPETPMTSSSEFVTTAASTQAEPPAPEPGLAAGSDPTAIPDEAESLELPIRAREEVILEWQAASRPFKKRSPRFYTTVAIIVLLICLILGFARQFVPIAVVVSVAFLSYVLAAVPPEKVTFQLTSFGIRVGSELFLWEELGQFWMEEKYGQVVAKITVDRFPFRLLVMLGDFKADDMRSFLSSILPEEKPIPTYLERAASWLETHVLLDEA